MIPDLGSVCWGCGRFFAPGEQRRGAELPSDAVRVSPIRNVLLCLPCAEVHAHPIPGRRHGLRLKAGTVDRPPPAPDARGPALTEGYLS